MPAGGGPRREQKHEMGWQARPLSQRCAWQGRPSPSPPCCKRRRRCGAVIWAYTACIWTLIGRTGAATELCCASLASARARPGQVCGICCPRPGPCGRAPAASITPRRCAGLTPPPARDDSEASAASDGFARVCDKNGCEATSHGDHGAQCHGTAASTPRLAPGLAGQARRMQGPGAAVSRCRRPSTPAGESQETFEG